MAAAAVCQLIIQFDSWSIEMLDVKHWVCALQIALAVRALAVIYTPFPHLTHSSFDFHSALLLLLPLLLLRFMHDNNGFKLLSAFLTLAMFIEKQLPS